jgi:hypothetical protein
MSSSWHFIGVPEYLSIFFLAQKHLHISEVFAGSNSVPPPLAEGRELHH